MKKKQKLEPSRKELNMQEKGNNPQKAVFNEEIYIDPTICIEELSILLKLPKNKIIKSLLLKGIPTTPNQPVNAEIIQQLEDEYKIKIFVNSEPLIPASTPKTVITSEQTQRPPVVAIIGHANHGKTTLLNKIKKNQAQKREHTEVTQKINAYESNLMHKGEKRKILFLDTPGHETFSITRAKSLYNSDLAILVVAIDDGIKPQTIEAIEQAKHAQVPLVVAINKTDNADFIPAKVEQLKKQLTEYNLIAEEWGGDTLIVEINALQGHGITELLENVMLQADILNLKANSRGRAKGTILETTIHNTKGSSTSILIKEGTLQAGDTIVIGDTWSKIKNMIDTSGNTVSEAAPSSVVITQALLTIPTKETNFSSFRNTKDAEDFIKIKESTKVVSKNQPLFTTYFHKNQENIKQINLVLKAESQSLLEAIASNIPTKENPSVNVRILRASVGYITQTDIEFAITSKSEILAFNTTYAPGTKRFAINKNISVKNFKLIYEALEYIAKLENGSKDTDQKENIAGIGIVKAIFPAGKSLVAGILVTKGMITKKSLVHVTQNLNLVFSGNVKSLKRGKEDISEAQCGSECGICLEGFATWNIGDTIHAFNQP